MKSESEALPDQSPKLNDEVRRHRIDLIEKVIRAYSPSGHEGKVAILLHEELLTMGLHPRIDRAGNVICESGTGSTTLLFCGHMDTVPGELQVAVDERTVSGRGACDAKGALLSLLFAFEDLARSKSIGGQMIFAGVTDEEKNSVGLNELIRNNVKADYAIFGEPGGPSRITVGYRGHLTTRLKVMTPEVHASAPMLTTNSVEVAFEIYNKIKREFNALDSKSTDQVSAAVTELHAGSAHNVIPGETHMTVDVRFPFGYSSNEARSSIERVLSEFRLLKKEVQITVDYDEPTEAYRVKLESPLVRAMSRAILRSGKKPTFIAKSGTGDMNTYALTFGVDTLTYGPGDAKLSHTSQEVLSLEEIFECSSVLCNSASELFMMTSKSSTNEMEERRPA